jgi:hypothetical protein
MTSHFLLLLLFAAFVSTAFAVLLRDEVADQVRLGGMIFGSLVGAAVVFGWLMLPLPF